MHAAASDPLHRLDREYFEELTSRELRELLTTSGLDLRCAPYAPNRVAVQLTSLDALIGTAITGLGEDPIDALLDALAKASACGCFDAAGAVS